MSRIQREFDTVHIWATTPEGEEVVIHHVNTVDPSAVTGGSIGGIRCGIITLLDPPHDSGAQAKVQILHVPEFMLFPYTVSVLVREHPYELMNDFLVAGLRDCKRPDYKIASSFFKPRTQEIENALT